jgi:hypothetical protein
MPRSMRLVAGERISTTSIGGSSRPRALTIERRLHRPPHPLRAQPVGRESGNPAHPTGHPLGCGTRYPAIGSSKVPGGLGRSASLPLNRRYKRHRPLADWCAKVVEESVGQLYNLVRSKAEIGCVRPRLPSTPAAGLDHNHEQLAQLPDNPGRGALLWHLACYWCEDWRAALPFQRAVVPLRVRTRCSVGSDGREPRPRGPRVNGSQPWCVRAARARPEAADSPRGGHRGGAPGARVSQRPLQLTGEGVGVLGDRFGPHCPHASTSCRPGGERSGLIADR